MMQCFSMVKVGDLRCNWWWQGAFVNISDAMELTADLATAVGSLSTGVAR